MYKNVVKPKNSGSQFVKAHGQTVQKQTSGTKVKGGDLRARGSKKK